MRADLADTGGGGGGKVAGFFAASWRDACFGFAFFVVAAVRWVSSAGPAFTGARSANASDCRPLAVDVIGLREVVGVVDVRARTERLPPAPGEAVFAFGRFVAATLVLLGPADLTTLLALSADFVFSVVATLRIDGVALVLVAGLLFPAGARFSEALASLDGSLETTLSNLDFAAMALPVLLSDLAVGDAFFVLVGVGV